VAEAFPPQTPYVRPVRSRHSPANVAGLGLVFTGFFVFMFGTTVASVTGIVHPVLVALLGFGLMFGGGAVFSMPDSGERPRVAPPPAMLPFAATTLGPRGAIEIPCPNCGAPPQAIDRFGVATCPYCQTRYLVR
jgi:hypothetical protein